jgi:hypothetical protein
VARPGEAAVALVRDRTDGVSFYAALRVPQVLLRL